MISAIIIATLVTIYSLAPLLEHLTQSLPDTQDGLLIVWILNQTVAKIPFGIEKVFQTNIFYPYTNTLGFTNTLIPSAIIGKFAEAFGYIAVANFATISAQFLTTLFSYLFIRDVTKSRFAASIATVAFTLSQIRFLYVQHLQLFVLQWFVLALWMIYRFFKVKKPKYLYFASLIAAIQMWENILPIYWLVVFATVFSLKNLALLRRNKKHIFFSALMLLVLSFPILYLYQNTHSVHHFARSIRDAAHFSLDIKQFFTVFFSFGLFVSTIYAVFISKVVNKKFIVILVTTFVLALGPVLKFNGETVKLIERLPIPLPYSLLYFAVPGFNAFRTTSRWLIPFSFTMSLILAQSLALIVQEKKYVSTLLIIILIILGSTRLMHVEQVRQDVPEVYTWLSKQDIDTVLELPIYGLGEIGAIYETQRMYYSLFHNKTLVNGYSGFLPEYQTSLIHNFEDTNIQAEFVIVNKHLDKESYFQNYFFTRLTDIYEDDQFVVYNLVQLNN